VWLGDRDLAMILVDEGSKDSRRCLVLFLLEKTIWLSPAKQKGSSSSLSPHGWKSPPSPSFIWLLLHSTEFGERRKTTLH
jgi:hypothetical protein